MTSLLVVARRCTLRSALLPVFLGGNVLFSSLSAQVAPTAAATSTAAKEVRQGQKAMPKAAIESVNTSVTATMPTMATVRSMPMTGFGTATAGGSNVEDVALKLLAIVAEQQAQIQKLQKQIDELQRQVATLQPKTPDTK
jgi:hypothetical protein